MKTIKKMMVVMTFFSVYCVQNKQVMAQVNIPPSSIVNVIPGYVFPTTLNPTLPTIGNGHSISATDATDIRVFPSSNPQSEVHISINKTNQNNILISAQTKNSLSYSFSGYYYTNDGGLTWSGADMLPDNGYGRGDPSTAFDATGNGFIATMSPQKFVLPNGYYIQKTTDNCASWQTQVRGYGPITPYGDFDKEMIAADNSPSSLYKNYFYCVWAEGWRSGNFTIKCNRSIDGGATFTSLNTLKTGKFGNGANVQTGPNGEVYICWADYTNGSAPGQNIGFTKSTDGGETFSQFSLAFSYSGIWRSDFAPDPLFGDTRVQDFPSMAVDKSCGTYKGRIYIVYPAKEGGTGKAVIQVNYSEDQGSTWSSATTVSISTGRQNWFPWIAVDDATGTVSVVYYSLDGASGFSTNTYMAYSLDGGVTFNNIKVSDVAHTTAPISGYLGGYAGYYIGVTAYGA